MELHIDRLLIEKSIQPVVIPLNTFACKISGIGSNWQADEVNLFLHGWLDNCYSFLPLLESFSQPFLAVDLPGHGMSPLSADGIPHFSDYLYYLYNILESIKAKSVNLIGHSMGGAIASLYAGTFPDKVNNLIMIEAIGPLSCQEAEAPQRLKIAIESHRKSSRRANPKYESKAMAASIRSRSGLSPTAAQILVERGVEDSPTGISWRHDPRLKLPSPRSFSEAQVLAYLQHISAPSLLIKGRPSYLTDSISLKKRIAAIKNLTVSTIDGGHHLHMENPKQTAKLITDFLQTKPHFP